MPVLTTITTSPNPQVGDTVYVPFWVVLEFLDIAPPDPFVLCTIMSLYRRRLQSPDGQVDCLVCDVELGKPDLSATGIPISYLIKPEQLQEWAERLAAWFRDYPGRVQASVVPTAAD